MEEIEEIVENTNPLRITVKIDCNEPFSEWFQLDMMLNEVLNYIAEKKNLDLNKLQFKKNDKLIEHKENDKLSEILDEKNIIYIVDKSKVVIDNRKVRDHFESENKSNFIFQMIERFLDLAWICFHFLWKMVSNVENKEKLVNINHRDESEKELSVTINIVDKTNEKNNDDLEFVKILPKEATLDNIRDILEKSSDEAHKMKSNYYFLNKDGSDIVREDESKRKLLEILNITDKKATLKITKTSNIDWFEKSTNGFNFKDFKDFTVFSIEKTPNKVFNIHNKEKMTPEPVRQASDENVEDTHTQDLSYKSNLIFDGNISTVLLPWISFSLGCSVKDLDQMLKTDSTSKKCSYMKVKKVEIKIPKECILPTPGFENDVRNALTNHDKKKALQRVAEKYGPFYARHIVFGGMFENKSFNTERSIMPYIVDSTNGFTYQSELANKSSDTNLRAKRQVIGGNPELYFQEDGKNKWMESLKDSQSWDIIEYNDIHLIFDLLDATLKKEVNEALGQRILLKNVKPFSTKFNKSREPGTYNLYEELKDIPDISECQIFTSIMCEKDEDIFSSRVDYKDKYSPIILIHHIISSKELRDKKKCKEHTIQIGWVVVGYCSNFDFSPLEYKVKIASRKLNNIETEPPYDPKSTTIAVSVHFSQSNNSACLFISDLNNSDLNNESNLAIDIERLKLVICTIEKCDNTGLMNINWKNDKSQSLISHGTGIDKEQFKISKVFKDRKCLSKVISKIRQQKQFKNPFFASIIFFEKCPPECSYHGFLTITSEKIMFGSLNNKPLKEGTGQITYFVLHETS
ncbi:23997_t:CDS:2 [Gigaspora margarita]|uniref:23997_t:CDS:1 n=1 Tax=Gigaspora margarita TaxID=4874 RepID=A0ABM8VY32_GIGMA|nr:23997_t:CDS:2 [Gigaspora margarita]